MATLNMDKIPDAIGCLVLNEEGAVVSSSGELENDEVTATKIFRFLSTSCRMPPSTDKKDYWKRIMVLWDDFMYVVTVANRKVYICKRNYPKQTEQVLV